MKLSEIRLFEEPIPTRSAEELWSENEGESAQYITTTIYYVKPTEKKDQFEVQYDDAGKRKRYGVLSKEDLTAAFTPIRPNQKPDAEGFVQHRSADVFDAFKYTGSPVKVVLSGDAPLDGEAPAGETVKLSNGDYMLRQDTDDEFVYTIEKANFFDNGYVKK